MKKNNWLVPVSSQAALAIQKATKYAKKSKQTNWSLNGLYYTEFGLGSVLWNLPDEQTKLTFYVFSRFPVKGVCV